MSKILIIEDDENILDLEKDYIEASEMRADGATDGNTGLELALNNEYDLILLDVMLPGINGFEICKKIRETKNIPIIFGTAKRDEIDKISGLGYGADDYIVKPFSPAELVARIKAHISRYKTLTSHNSENGDILVRGDTSTLTVHINRLRDKIKEADENTDCIKTIWGRGYKFK